MIQTEEVYLLLPSSLGEQCNRLVPLLRVASSGERERRVAVQVLHVPVGAGSEQLRGG